MMIGGIQSLHRDHPAQASAPSMRLLRSVPGDQQPCRGCREWQLTQAKRLPTIFHVELRCLLSSTEDTIIAEIKKLSVEKAPIDFTPAMHASSSQPTVTNLVPCIVSFVPSADTAVPAHAPADRAPSQACGRPCDAYAVDSFSTHTAFLPWPQLLAP